MAQTSSMDKTRALLNDEIVFPNPYNGNQSCHERPLVEVAGKQRGRDANMKQTRLTDRPVVSTSGSGSGKIPQKASETSTFQIDIEGMNFKNDALWPFLVETVKRNPLYAGLIGYTREKVLPNEPDITVRELASKLSVSPGEAMVLLFESRSEK